jgi:hypothetical protein
MQNDVPMRSCVQPHDTGRACEFMATIKMRLRKIDFRKLGFDTFTP